jgi:plasmid stabilization system protein ParE
LIDYTDEALEHVRDLRRHYESWDRAAAIRSLMRALAEAEARIELTPGVGLPAPRPYPQVARPGRAWIKSGRYWIVYTTTTSPPVIAGVFYDAADIPRRL